MSILGIGLLLLQVQLGNINGIVTKPGGTEPLSGATVILNPVVSRQTSHVRSTISEDDGRFAIPDIEPGEYRLEVQSPRYGTAAYGQRRPDGPGTILKIGAGQRLSDLKLTMWPTGTIAGRITGRSGEPLVNATVQALIYCYQDGKRILAVAQTTTTDDRGDYRLFWLSSGKYVVVAGLRSSLVNTGAIGPLRPGDSFRTTIVTRSMTSDALLEASNLTKRLLEDGTLQEESWMPTYYPATTDRAQSTAVDVAAGSTVTGINITLGPSRVQKIRGRVTNAAGPLLVSLSAGNQGSIGGASTNASPIDGSFEFAGVLPGSYVLTAQDRAGLVSAAMVVVVGDRDVENLSLGLERGITLSVRLTAEGMPPGSIEPFNGIVGTLRPVMDAFQAPGTFRVPNVLLGAGNAMPFPNVLPGDYQFQISQAGLRDNAKPLYIKSIRLGREDAMGTFHLSADSAQVLEVVLTTETGAVEGVAIGRAGDPTPNATVVLVPTNARKRIALYQALVTGSDGRFRFQEIPPGDYKLFAWEDIETGAWANAEFIRTYESRGRAVRVSENSKEEVQLNVIYNP